MSESAIAQGCVWDFGPPERWPEEDLVAIGADLAPSTLVAAYRSSLFPMPLGGTIGWFSPVTRGILEPDGMHVSRSLRRSVVKFEIRINTSFREVIDACADPGREGRWIDQSIREAYVDLHELGLAASVETWLEDRLVGGLYGVIAGGLFAGESMFHRATDASKVALLALTQIVRGASAPPGAADRLIDVQWSTEHLESLGIIEISRTDYLARLPELLPIPAPEALVQGPRVFELAH